MVLVVVGVVLLGGGGGGTALAHWSVRVHTRERLESTQMALYLCDECIEALSTGGKGATLLARTIRQYGVAKG